MSKTFFVMISTDPDIDPMKSLVALACATQATSDGHEVNVFFAANAVKLLQADYLKSLDSRVSQLTGFCKDMFDNLIQRARIYCSTLSQAVNGVTPDNAHDVLVGGYELQWSGPPGVVTLSSSADVTLSF
ncbi:MAG: DsrE family protein [Arenicellales bacterium]